jgi:hypothetical protein
VIPDGVRTISTNLDATPMEILGWSVSRWSVETTFHESRAHPESKLNGNDPTSQSRK